MARLQTLPPDEATGRARWRLLLSPLEGGVIAGLPGQLEALLADPEGNRRVIARLFPAAYADPDLERENRRLLGETLLEGRRELLAQVRADLAAAGAGVAGRRLDLDAVGIDRWLRFVNDVRLVMATDLGVEDDLGEELPVAPEHPDAPRYALLDYLGGLESMLVDAVSSEL